MIKTPILLLLYNRPNLTEELLKKLSKIGNFDSIYVSIDGPKISDHDMEKVSKVAQIVDTIDFANNVFIRKNEKNLGCKLCVSRSISWFFQNVKEGIILEDDCHPEPEFFTFAEKMLNRYRTDNRIAQICGYNTLGYFDSDDDYFYSNFGSIWGWATWRRSWKFYDLELNNYKNSLLHKFNLRKKISFYFDALVRIRNFENVKRNQVDTWDYQWMHSRLTQNMLCVIPKVSLINNVGFGIDATHTINQPKLIKNNVLLNIRKKTKWDRLAKPNIMMPNYLFELKVAEYKRGWRGLGPIYILKKFPKIVISLLKNIFKL